ncbi:MAG: AAA family ATPase [Thermoplasmata archaeon]|nr:AAA family ATPase [Thermoplasmata archaeon]
MSKNEEEVLKEFLDLPGVGMSKAKALYEAGYDSPEKLAEASIEDLVAIKGITKKVATTLYEHFSSDEEPEPEIEEKKSDDDILLEKGVGLYAKGKWGQALQIVNDLIEENPKNIKALMVKGDIYLDREKYQLALDSYDVVTELDPEIDNAWVGKGNALLAMEKNVRAKSCFKKALAINPDNDAAAEKLDEDDRLPTFVDGLDEMLEGGVPSKHVVLVCGRAGSMKSSFCYYMLHKLAENEGRKTIYLSLEQSRQSLLRHMKRLGMRKETASTLMVSDLDDMVVVDMAALRKEGDVSNEIDWLGSIINQLRSYKESFGADAIAIDSLSALYSLTTFTNPRSELFFFFEKLRDLDLTVFLISEMYGENLNQYGPYGVEEFLADGIIHIKTEAYANRANLFLGVVKMRETNHPRDYFPMIVDQYGFGIVRD